MIDNIKIKKHIELIKHVEQRLNTPLHKFNLVFDPVIRNGSVISYRTKIDNLYLSIREDTLFIQNSLTKYYHGYNHLNFTYSQLNLAVNRLENHIGVPLRDAILTSFEFGVVIVDNKIYETFSKMGAYKNIQPESMNSHGRIYGIRFQNSLQKIKIYDKTFEAKKRYGLDVGLNLLRVEKVYSKGHIRSLAKFKDNSVLTLGDLSLRKNLELLGEDLMESLNKIELKNIPKDPSKLSAKELRIWGYRQFELTKNAMKKYHFDANKNDRSLYNKLQKEYRQYELDQFLQEVQNKIQFSIDN